MASTKKKKPNKCVKGQPCGFSCISWFNKDGSKRKCFSPVDKKVVEEALKDVPEIPVPKTKKKKSITVSLKDLSKRIKQDKTVLEAVSDIDPAQLKITKKDLGEWSRLSDKEINIATIAEIARKAGISEESALVMAHGIKSWITGGYNKLSDKTFKKEKDRATAAKPEDIAALAAVAAGLKVLPKVTKDELTNTKVSKEWDKKTVKRWVTIQPQDLDNFLSQYQPNSEVTEKGLFGASIRSNEGMPYFSGPSNVEYVVTPKLDGSGRGHYMEQYKRKSFGNKEVTDSEGEVLFEPGTKFKVTKVEKGREALSQVFETNDPEVNIKNLNDSEEKLNQYIKDNKDTLMEDGFDFDRPYRIIEGYDDNNKPKVRKANKDEAINALKSGGVVDFEIKKRHHRIFMEES